MHRLARNLFLMEIITLSPEMGPVGQFKHTPVFDSPPLKLISCHPKKNFKCTSLNNANIVYTLSNNSVTIIPLIEFIIGILDNQSYRNM